MISQRWTLKLTFLKEDLYEPPNFEDGYFNILLNNLLSLIQLVILSTSIPDVRHCKLMEHGLFTDNSLYRSLTSYQDATDCFR